MKNPKISIVIPVYNMAEYITICLDSLARQTLKEYEAICVDDGSTDDSVKIIREYAQKDSRVRLIEFGENRGVFAARNKALECAQGEFIAFLDPDDWYPEEDVLEDMYCTAKNNGVKICGGGWTNFYPDKAPQSTFGGTLWGLGCFKNPGVIDYKDYQFDFGYQRFIFDRRMLQENGINFPPYTRFQDPPFFVRAMTVAGKFYGMNRSTYNYRASYKTVDFSKNDYLKARDLIKGVKDIIDFSLTSGLERLHTLLYDRCNNMTACFADAIRNNRDAFVGVCELELSLDKELIERNKSFVTSGMRPFIRPLQELFQSDEWCSDVVSDFKDIRKALNYYGEYVADGASAAVRKQLISRFWDSARRPCGTPKMSILIPAYNVQDSVSVAIESALAQTMPEIEILCVDDGSTDQTWNVICDYAKRDPRVLPIRHSRNLGLYMARKTAVLIASGEYVTFLDSDDELVPSACADVYAAAKKSGADFVHAPVEVVNTMNLPESRVECLRKLTRPFSCSISGKDLLSAMFAERSVGTAMVGKAYSNGLVRKAYSALRDLPITMAEDVMGSFAIATFAQSYYPMTERPFYRYMYGAGMTGKAGLSLEKYQARCREVDVIPEIKRFIDSEGVNHQMREKAFSGLKTRLLNDAYGCIESFLSSKENQCEGMRYFAERVGRLEFVKYLASRFIFNRTELIQKLDYLGFVPSLKAKSVKTIGFLYFHLTMGGVQRVITLLIPMFQAMGYKIVLFIEEQIDETCYKLPDGVELVYLLSSRKCTPANISERLECLARGIAENDVDVMLYHPYSSHIMPWDMLVCKIVCKIPFVLHFHNCVGITLYAPDSTPSFSYMPARLRMCDKVVALSRTDALYFQSQGVDAEYIPNPVSPELSSVSVASSWNRKTILWCARISWEKHPLDPILIFDKVRRRVPGAKLVIVGDGAPDIMSAMRCRIAEYGLEDSIELAGRQTDTYPYYRQATAFLMTSSFEGFPMTLLEAGMHGVPTVMYALPFLEAARGNAGIAQVASGNFNEAADALCEILLNQDVYRSMSAANRQHMESFAHYDQASKWGQVLQNVSHSGTNDILPQMQDVCRYDEIKILLEELQYCYQAGFNTFAGRIKWLDSELKKSVAAGKRLEEDLKSSLENSKSLDSELKKSMANNKCLEEEHENLIGKNKKLISQYGKDVSILNGEVENLKNSESYKIGLLLTWPLRKILKFVCRSSRKA